MQVDANNLQAISMTFEAPKLSLFELLKSQAIEAGDHLKEEAELFGKPVKLTLKFPGDYQLQITRKMGETVATVKRFLTDEYDFPYEALTLEMEGKILVDPLSLNDFLSAETTEAAFSVKLSSGVELPATLLAVASKQVTLISCDGYSVPQHVLERRIKTLPKKLEAAYLQEFSAYLQPVVLTFFQAQTRIAELERNLGGVMISLHVQ